MRITKIMQLSESEETISKVLEELQEDFEIVDDVAEKMKRDISDNPETIRTYLSKLGGAHSNLKTALGIVESFKTNTQLQYYHDKRDEFIKDNPRSKFNVSATKEDARAQVLNYRRVRNLLQYYVESASTNITVLQSLKKREEQNRQTPGE